ncbi:MAG: translation initiation factor IF-2, partial [Deltaproteobacteria bacterium]|nr:translation initiation factor IF-2 [Deltaproteobacteria bacterium]
KVKGSKKKEIKVVAKKSKKTEITVPKAIKRRIKIVDTITVSDLAKRMSVKASEIIKKLIGMGVMATINQALDYETSSLVAVEFGYEVEKGAFEESEMLMAEVDEESTLLFRPPVVTIMGHVDHGKTTLLDAIRESNIIKDEAGGITQHIGAYHVKLSRGEIVFLDTPGHEAFTAMRARGAQVTDFVILVVAADDGVKQQTKEAINHAKSAGVPIIVAINKIDKANANPDKVKKELAEEGLIPEDWSGTTIFVEVSAKQKVGIDELLEMIILQAEILELKANPNKLARGRIIEAKLDKGRGPVATVLVQEGTLRAGDHFVCGTFYGKVRALFNDRGKKIESAGPSTPVEVQGISGVPMAGDEFICLDSERKAKQISVLRADKLRLTEVFQQPRITLENLMSSIKDGQVKELNTIIRADVQGSIEALRDSLLNLSTSEVKVNVIHCATGAITETDIMLASASNAIIIGFNVRPNPNVTELGAKEKVSIHYYDVIYNVIDDIKKAMSGLLEPDHVEKVLGRAEVRQTFHIPKIGMVAGAYVLDGRIERNARVRLLRDNVVVFNGRISGLRRFKEDVKDVSYGYECGISIDNYNDLKVNDIIESYMIEDIKRTID